MNKKFKITAFIQNRNILYQYKSLLDKKYLTKKWLTPKFWTVYCYKKIYLE